MSTIRVAVSGAAGKMGQEVVRALQKEADLKLVAAFDPSAKGQDAGEVAGIGHLGVTIEQDPEDGIEKAQVLVDFTEPAVVKRNIHTALQQGVRPVVGTTGLSMEDISDIRRWAKSAGLGVIIAPNFALGALLLMRFAKIASQYFPHGEIIELHHDQKKDAPSGTAIKTAQMMAEARGQVVQQQVSEEKLGGVRGGVLEGINIHSVRLPGLIAHQEVIFGGSGQLLTLRHDSTSRESFMPGVMLAIRKVLEVDELIYGLEQVLFGD
ncbi:MAG: 4-hydroxy-tetrahydrodipicolinate reductase [Limnochordia bacterium]